MDEFARRWASLMRLAGRQMGLFTVEDARTCGVHRRSLQLRADDRRLTRLYPGVYAVAGTPDSWERRALAAQLAGGPNAVLCGEAAGFLHGLLDVRRGEIELVFPRNKNRLVNGVRTREARNLLDSDVTRVGPHRVTSVDGTLADLADRRGARWAERAYYDAWRRGLTDPDRTRFHLAAHARNVGGPILREILDRSEPSFTRAASPAEVDGLLALRDAGIPMPEVNHEVLIAGRRRYIDLAWPLAKVAVEIDGRSTHSIAPDLAADRARQEELEAAGWRVVRIPAAWLVRDPKRAADRIRAALRDAGHPAVA